MSNVSRFNKPIEPGNATTNPTNIENGTQYYNSVTNKLTVYENGVWVTYPTKTEFDSFVTETRNLSKSIAVITDSKPNGTAGGTFTSGAWRTRTLNTLSDPMSIITSLASNEFTLPAGRYEIEAFAVGYLCGLNKIKLRNVTDNVDVVIGSNSFSNASSVQGISQLDGVFTIDSAKTFQLQHWCSVTRNTNGFGLAVSAGVDEVYASIKIRKLST